MDRQMEQLKSKYKEIPVPAELDQVIEGAVKNRKRRSFQRSRLSWAVGAAAAFVILVGFINTNPAVAKAVSNVPVLGSLVEVLTFSVYQVEDGNYQADINVPAITNTGNPSLEESLNQAYLADGQKQYDAFMAEMEKQKALGEDGHIRMDSGYHIKTDTEQILSVGRYVDMTIGSSATMLKYDTIDKKNRILLTLPSLFKDDRYIEVISENIKSQMREQMQQDDSKIFWIEPADAPAGDHFTSISKDQNFYINADHQLVISFSEYEVAPGYMGAVEFIIPTEALEDVLVSREYLK